MKNREVPPFASPCRADSDLLASQNAPLEQVSRFSIVRGRLHVRHLAKICAMARTIAHRDTPHRERIELAATLEMVSGQARSDVLHQLEILKFSRTVRRVSRADLSIDSGREAI